MVDVKHCGHINVLREFGFLQQPVRCDCALLLALRCHNMYVILVLRHTVFFIQRQERDGSCASRCGGVTESSSLRTRWFCDDRWSNGYGFFVALLSLALKLFNTGLGALYGPLIYMRPASVSRSIMNAFEGTIYITPFCPQGH